MLGFYSGLPKVMTFNAIFEPVAYVYGLSFAAFYITQVNIIQEPEENT